MALAWKAGWVNSPQGFESPILRRWPRTSYDVVAPTTRTYDVPASAGPYGSGRRLGGGMVPRPAEDEDGGQRVGEHGRGAGADEQRGVVLAHLAGLHRDRGDGDDDGQAGGRVEAHHRAVRGAEGRSVEPRDEEDRETSDRQDQRHHDDEGAGP